MDKKLMRGKVGAEVIERTGSYKYVGNDHQM